MLSSTAILPSQFDRCQTPETIIMHHEQDPIEKKNLQKALDLEKASENIKFRYESNICNTYNIGIEVVPGSNNKGGAGNGANPPQNATQFNPQTNQMELKTRSSVKAVLFASRKRDGRSVVIKMRNKTRSFKDQQEIYEWLVNMRLLFYISGGPQMLENPELEDRTSHPHVANVLDIIEDQNSYFVVMDHVKGRDLFDYFVQDRIYEKPYKVSVARQIAKELITGLAELHDMGLVHKDIKLENIVLDEARTKQHGSILLCPTKIVDFDTVEIFRPGTKSFHVLGTDQYISPETYAGYSTPSSDIWAVGVIFFTILTGSFPFHASIFDDLPGENYSGHSRMDQIRRRLRIARVDFSNKIWVSEPLAKDFVRKCFVTDSKKRMTCKEALEHEWLRDVKIKLV